MGDIASRRKKPVALTPAPEPDEVGLVALVRRIEAVAGATPACRELAETLREASLLPPLRSEELTARVTLDVRKFWLSLAHRSSDLTVKSPLDGVRGRLPTGARVDFGYERDLDVGVLEKRGDTYVPVPEGMAGATAIFRSGQSTLSALLQFAMMNWSGDHPVSVAHRGAYFETATLLRKWSASTLRMSTDCEVDVVVAEPVWCDGQAGITLPHDVPTARRLLIIDTTLVSHDIELAAWLKCLAPGALCVLMRSGLKLDQAGLELANVGITRIFGWTPERVGQLHAGLLELRGLNGTGLTFDEMSALSAPWFMDPAYASLFAAEIFRNNALLAQAIGDSSAIFEAKSHPSLFSVDAVAPFCCLRLRDDNDEARCEALMAWLHTASRHRGLHFDRGGSFGFRGHRYDLIVSQELPPFIRIAMGFGARMSRDGICEMIGELSRLTPSDFDGRLRP